ncbi:MAG: peptide-methionine (S)-S-oxide reductase MsrA [Chloroflexi bacterium]|nr:peptide-methionine (S)-S-oxide reductase MsrA [Chloroflexota bacterium]
MVGGGCFWCLEAVFEQLRGVESIQSGYCGGKTRNPTYDDVCGGDTGHAEVVQVAFDPVGVSFKDILEIFFTIHDPTTLNRQGPDVGTQYRSAIFYTSPEQKAVADQVIKEFNAKKVWPGPIVTEVASLQTFYPAEDFHRQYYRNNPDRMYCRFIIDPKVAKFRKQFFDKLKK